MTGLCRISALHPEVTTMEQLVVPIDQTPEYIYHLRGVVHPRPELRQKGYIFDQLTPSELERKKRCEKCSRGKGHHLLLWICTE